MIPESSCPAGTPLRGLNYFKGRDDPVALKEDEYPEWLWRCLDAKRVEGEDDASAGDEFCASPIPFPSRFHQLKIKYAPANKPSI